MFCWSICVQSVLIHTAILPKYKSSDLDALAGRRIRAGQRALDGCVWCEACTPISAGIKASEDVSLLCIMALHLRYMVAQQCCWCTQSAVPCTKCALARLDHCMSIKQWNQAAALL